MTSKEKSTREKILEVAARLFGEVGYHKTSIREIAKQAEVNLAAINYHFNNKENLYCEVFNRNFNWFAEAIADIENQNPSIDVENLSWEIFMFFQNNARELLFIHKMVLANDVPLPESFTQDRENILEFGPPGGEVLQRSIEREIGPNLPPFGILWAVSSIFAHIVHTAAMTNSSLIQKHCENSPLMDKKLREFNTRHLVHSIIEYLDKNREIWKNPPSDIQYHPKNTDNIY